MKRALRATNLIQEGDYVLIFSRKGKTWLVKAKSGQVHHTHLGRIDLGKLVGAEYGSLVKSATGETVCVLRPTVEDFLMKSGRLTQIVYPKDLGFMAIKCDVHAGSVVVEVGAGSGALTTYLASLVRPDGRVYSYDVNERFLKVASNNVAKAGLAEFVTFKHRDAKEGIDEANADAAIVDVGDPWTVAEVVWNSLAGGGTFAAICPTMNQAEKLADKLQEVGFVAVESMELLMRGLEARLGKTRPAGRMVGHTAYLTFARKVLSTKVKSEAGTTGESKEVE